MLDSSIDHLLLYSDKLEETYRFLLKQVKLVPLTPLTPYGSFQSGMFALKNCIFEVLWNEKKDNGSGRESTFPSFAELSKTSP
ncbi:hypothetical protein [Leptospira vanthielii]|uniref:hypothetical protein n=1 Tax=Leptospira vanthielii TaxID=293085 RepID=UPI000305FB22|nr:hypothetical protein [Leptospira vanthielii]